MNKIKSWKTLDSINQLEEIKETSNTKTQILFKHSVTCGISGHAEFKLESDWNFEDENFDFYYLDLLANRVVSNEIASMFQVTHQSPQILIIKNGKATAHFSHQAISVDRIKQAL
ncbi:MAG: bacillithiol system redox-active protein YtxJ [Chitinophagales bacterium]